MIRPTPKSWCIGPARGPFSGKGGTPRGDGTGPPRSPRPTDRGRRAGAHAGRATGPHPTRETGKRAAGKRGGGPWGATASRKGLCPTALRGQSHGQLTGTLGGTQPTSQAVVADACGSSANIHAISSRSVEGFYDGLAGEYHLIFGDWWSAAQWARQHRRHTPGC